MHSAYENKEKLIGQLLMGAACCFVGGLVITGLGLVFTSVLFFILGPILVIGALLMGAVALSMGFGHNKIMSGGAPRPPQEGRITTRFAINDIGEMIFDNYDYDAEDARFYVKVQFLGGGREEFECARPVFDQCGEGMRGMLTIEGGWLSQFVALVDTQETRDAYRDW